jgi:hypothetical protein
MHLFAVERSCSNLHAGCLKRTARTASPRWWGLAATRTCAGGLLPCRGRLASTLQNLAGYRGPPFQFSVNGESAGSGGVQSQLTAPRRITPGAVAPVNPAKAQSSHFGAESQATRLLFFHWATGRISVATPTANGVQVVLNVANDLRR